MSWADDTSQKGSVVLIHKSGLFKTSFLNRITHCKFYSFLYVSNPILDYLTDLFVHYYESKNVLELGLEFDSNKAPSC
jgi:hypothetical protein